MNIQDAFSDAAQMPNTEWDPRQPKGLLPSLIGFVTSGAPDNERR
jgi:hypothetical protein